MDQDNINTPKQIREILQEMLLTPKSDLLTNEWDGEVLTPIEQENALNEAKRLKYWAKKDERDRERKRKYKESLLIPWDSVKLGDYIRWRAYEVLKMKRGLIADDSNKEILNRLCYYFSNDLRFEGDLNKGLLLFGGVGVGKTTLMQLFSSNQKASFKMIGVSPLCDLYARDGDSVIDIFSKPDNEPEDAKYFYQKKIGVCFDDLGTEKEKNHFGNKKNVMSDIILNWYANKFDTPFYFLHITTNLSISEIETMYGSRELSRFYEMFNLIELNGNDRRKS